MQIQVVEKGYLRNDLTLLFQNKRFVRLLISQTIQGLVFMAYMMTEQWYVVNQLHQSDWLALLLIIQGVLLVCIGQIEIIWVNLVSIVIVATCASMVSVPIFSFIQENTDKDMLGRVMGLLNIASLGILPLSYSMASLAFTVGISTPILLLICGVILIAFCLVVLSTNKGIRHAD